MNREIKQAISTINEMLNCGDNIELAFPTLTNALSTSYERWNRVLS